MNKKVPVKINEDQLEQLRSVKRKTGMTIDFVFGAAIAEWLIKHEPAIYEQGIKKLELENKI